ncbi:small subunit ribosomal protein S33 [Marchantia polymorpha subsp. ruderalis]|uniref:Small ribosomal subunit protein mS33 n=2 Tax=Marchantia polymorpha TaxID=3197 RepID=A0AAF6BCE4_MARPO|nr:hypothetical protein MARPO_0090s0044 [Marchantia polymorpha]BBN09678.1 hypothetical protein Mp_4g21770 [Marchantia polymorpha subsp. ruderalis]|eukprot:PTQ33307.1 hypothetical protein MARPO_0090s0044 [Marchantia polymorpha]
MAGNVVQAAARIFGNVIGNGLQSGRKVLTQKIIGQKIVEWYPTPMQDVDPCFDDPSEKRRILKLERLKRRGKGAPKKGHGKRASKK